MFLTYESGISHPCLLVCGGSVPFICISTTPRMLPPSYYPNGLPPYPQLSPWKWRKGARRGHVLEVAFISSTHPIRHTLATWPQSTLKRLGIRVCILSVQMLSLNIITMEERKNRYLGTISAQLPLLLYVFTTTMRSEPPLFHSHVKPLLLLPAVCLSIPFVKLQPLCKGFHGLMLEEW